jgi:hypothetical protein
VAIEDAGLDGLGLDLGQLPDVLEPDLGHRRRGAKTDEF